MRRALWWVPVGLLAAVALGFWGTWTWRLSAEARSLAYELEAERQRNFSNMAYHVEQIQSLLGKGLAAGSVRQNMRYMGDVHHHAQMAVNSFTSLPLPAEVQATTGKFLQQIGDFALSTLRNEAAGRDLDAGGRSELARLQAESQKLSGHLQSIATSYGEGKHRWAPPPQFSWAALFGRAPLIPGKPAATQDQAPASMVAGGWDQVGASVEKLPALLYDGPFSDHVEKRAPAMTGAPVTKEEAAGRIARYVPNAAQYRTTGVSEVKNNLPAWSFQLAPGGDAYTATVDLTKNGGHLVQYLNSRIVGRPTMDLSRAKTLGQEYLTQVGYTGMVATYGQVTDGTATIAYAFEENGVIIYPDQIKVKVALDTGEILAVDARQYLMSHHQRTLGAPKVSPEQADAEVNPDLAIQRVRLAVIPNQSGTGEILTYEFLTTLGANTYLVYINANTGMEEQILQQVESDGGTFAL